MKTSRRGVGRRRDIRFGAALHALSAAGLVTGCALQGNVAPDSLSLADRCADFIKLAMPFADIDIGERGSTGTDLHTIVAKAAGTRTDMPANTQVERNLAAECTFKDGVLAGFRWTKGGPAGS